MFISSLARVLREHQPADVAMCFDGEHAQDWRREIWPGYKKDHRSIDIWDTDYQLIMEFCHVARLPKLEGFGWEADDMVAAAWRVFGRAGRRIVICAEDADYHQLLDPGTIQVVSHSGTKTLDYDWVRSYYRCEPEQLIHLRALAGDDRDSIPGLPGIGIRKAHKLLSDNDWDAAFIENDAIDDVMRFVRIMDLRDPERCPDNGIHAEQARQLWWLDPWEARLSWGAEWTDPRDPGQAAELLEFLRRYELAVLAGRLATGKLW
jgi:5'-3' exonuclease